MMMDVTSTSDERKRSDKLQAHQSASLSPSLPHSLPEPPHRDVVQSLSLPTPSPEKAATKARDSVQLEYHRRMPWVTEEHVSHLRAEEDVQTVPSSQQNPIQETESSRTPQARRTDFSRPETQDAQETSLSSRHHHDNYPPQDLRPHVLLHGLHSRYANDEDPRTRRHKFTDSEGSYSSYNSSRSRSHSRISSVTTVGSHWTGINMADRPEEAVKPTTQPTESHPQDGSQVHNTLSGQHADDATREEAWSRPPQSTLGSIPDTRGPAPPEAQYPQASLRFEGPRQLERSKSHKRAISAPDFRHPSTYRTLHSTSRQGTNFSPLPRPFSNLRGEATPEERSTHGDLTMTSSPPASSSAHRSSEAASGSSMFQQTLPSGEASTTTGDAGAGQPPDREPPRYYAVTEEEEEQAVLQDSEQCFFVTNCNTGSALRKAISHFFGRNKSCTKKIPRSVWVYYCRKHYQRVRYRNADTYPRQQMTLIMTQLNRLQAWDKRNRRNGSEQRIQHWILSLRKREKNRLTADAEDTDGDDNGESDIVAPPEWLKEHIDKQFSTSEIIEIAEQLQREVQTGVLSGIPEIEFLPEISGPTELRPRRTTRRPRGKQSTGTKRKASPSPQVESAQTQFTDEHGPPSFKRPRFESSRGHRRSQTLGGAPTGSLPPYRYEQHQPSELEPVGRPPTIIPEMLPVPSTRTGPPGHGRSQSTTANMPHLNWEEMTSQGLGTRTSHRATHSATFQYGVPPYGTSQHSSQRASISGLPTADMPRLPGIQSFDPVQGHSQLASSDTHRAAYDQTSSFHEQSSRGHHQRSASAADARGLQMWQLGTTAASPSASPYYGRQGSQYQSHLSPTRMDPPAHTFASGSQPAFASSYGTPTAEPQGYGPPLSNMRGPLPPLTPRSTQSRMDHGNDLPDFRYPPVPQQPTDVESRIPTIEEQRQAEEDQRHH